MSKTAKVIITVGVFFIVLATNNSIIFDYAGSRAEMRAEFDAVNDQLDAAKEQLEELKSMLERKT